VLLVNLLAAVNFANVFFKNKDFWNSSSQIVFEPLRNVKNVTKIKKNIKNVLHLCMTGPWHALTLMLTDQGVG